jgi:hypothetical protein
MDRSDMPRQPRYAITATSPCSVVSHAFDWLLEFVVVVQVWYSCVVDGSRVRIDML